MEALYLPLGAGVLALLFAGFLARRVLAYEEGTDLMKEIGAAIQEGAAAFLKREYAVLGVFVAVVFVILLVMGFVRDAQAPEVAYAYLVGALSSALTGIIGMYIAVRANTRTAAAARVGLNRALRVAFSSGGVMGISVVGIGILGAVVLWIIFEDATIVAGFSFGASSIALFARVGGGIFTKAAGVGGDLAGKIEAGIPEDDPRNAAVIADNVGDNVGDVAGMGADLFEPYAGPISPTPALAGPAAPVGVGPAGAAAGCALPRRTARPGAPAGQRVPWADAGDKGEGLRAELGQALRHRRGGPALRHPARRHRRVSRRLPRTGAGHTRPALGRSRTDHAAANAPALRTERRRLEPLAVGDFHADAQGSHCCRVTSDVRNSSDSWWNLRAAPIRNQAGNRASRLR